MEQNIINRVKSTSIKNYELQLSRHDILNTLNCANCFIIQ